MNYIEKNQIYPVAMTIAGSDSGGGAGIQADLRTFNAFGVFGCSAITAVTAQNPHKVSAVMPVDAEVLQAQIETVLKQIDVKITKSGMLANKDNVTVVAKSIEKYKIQLVLDPVIVSTSGAKLLEDSAIDEMKNTLLPLAKWITPNIPEAEVLLSKKINGANEYANAALECYKKWGCSVLLKTGHATEKRELAIDYVCHKGTLYSLSAPKLEIAPLTTHGTGCTLSAALTAALCVNLPWDEALKQAKEFVLGSLIECVKIGNNTSAMYPPVEDYSQMVRLEKL